eukprot:m51a1_g879 putative 7sk snrna methylphosphate capping enzyme (309) ;mRNA; f:884496-885632
MSDSAADSPAPAPASEPAPAPAAAPVPSRSLPEANVRPWRKPVEVTPARTRDRSYTHGNYNRYYGYRHDNDRRVSYLRREWIEGKDVLDIGCNSGVFTVDVAMSFHPKSMRAIDVDGLLIRKAKGYLEARMRSEQQKQQQRQQQQQKSHDDKAKEAEGGEEDVAAEPPQKRQCVVVKEPARPNVVFETEDFMASEEAAPTYDVILCMSVTKWIHLNFGDAGIRRMFRKMFELLRPGGLLILEPQPFSSYKHKAKQYRELKAKYSQLELRPRDFADILTSQVGFSRVDVLHMPPVDKGFDRPVFAYWKE